MTASTKKFFSGFFTLSGTIIGASFLALPYISIRSGLLVVFGYLIVLTIFVFFIFGAIAVFFGIRAVSKINFLDAGLFGIVLVVVAIFGWSSWKAVNLFSGSGFGLLPQKAIDFFLPYGVILSALWGATIIPEIEEMLGVERKLFRKIVPWGTIAPAVFYLLFILVVTGIAGTEISSEAASGLKNYLPPLVSALVFLFGLIVVFSSYISIGLSLRNTLRYDFKIKKKFAWAIACFAPFFLYLIGFRNFIGIMGFVGAIALAIEGILIILMYNKIKGKWALTFPLILIFVAGIVYEIIYFLG